MYFGCVVKAIELKNFLFLFSGTGGGPCKVTSQCTWRCRVLCCCTRLWTYTCDCSKNRRWWADPYLHSSRYVLNSTTENTQIFFFACHCLTPTFHDFHLPQAMPLRKLSRLHPTFTQRTNSSHARVKHILNTSGTLPRKQQSTWVQTGTSLAPRAT